MNCDNILKVAQALEQGSLAHLGIDYDQKAFYIKKTKIPTGHFPYQCETTCCLAGWAVMAEDLEKGNLTKEDVGKYTPDIIYDRAIKYLDLFFSQRMLFTSYNTTPAKTAGVLRDMVSRQKQNPEKEITPNWNLEIE